MSQSPDLRAGDEDRDRTITRLREAYAEGRLTQDEFETRMGQAATARTFSDLDTLTVDLPASTSASASVAVPAASTADAAADEHERENLRKGWAAWVGVSVLVNVIWLGTWITGDEGAPPYWPIWVMGPWGAAMLIGTISRRRR